MTGAGAVLEAFADYVDGESAVVHRVALRLSPDRLTIALPDGTAFDWMADELREVPDQADSAGLVLAPAGDMLHRLHVGTGEIARLIRLNAPALRRRPPVENKGKIAAWAAGAIASVSLIIFVLVPVMANQLALLLPPAGERALGDATFEQVRTALGDADFLPVELCETPEGLAALTKMEARLDVGPDLPYPVTVAVLDHDLVNAFALPGGRVILFRGLIEAAENPEEVAAILAHEIGHVVNRDPTRDALRLAGSIGVLGLIFGDFAGGTVMLLLANQLINAKYSQAAEIGADDYAHAVLTEAGLPPAALGTFFERLRAEHGDEAGWAAHFSTHPRMVERVDAALEAQARAEAAGGAAVPALSASEWRDLRSICGPNSASEQGAAGRVGRQ
ncbi:M48 family metallopeptidase [Maritimibacter sp. HL-12]|uniref:M48 family metallopeptidase n=1 Tax=Maritimibacter sp. HL-12 TaxID=1162418 RepID=UPI000A0EF4E3|nr:M48 family metallopeptidase [Maritimibacter sp. HL-12]SMH48447.1 Peptidase family M48 [Maritimibacter sp. HL-12]